MISNNLNHLAESFPTSDEAAGTLILPPLEEGGGRASLWEMLLLAVDSLRANRMRAALTMLGITIGVASVVALLAIGGGASSAITGSIQSAGANLLTIQPGSPTVRGPGSVGSAQTLTLADADAVAALGLPLRGVAPQYGGVVQLVAPAADHNAQVLGTTPDYAVINELALVAGVFFTTADERTGAPVIVLGANVAAELFGAGPAVGERVRIKGQGFTVIGVLAARGGSPFGSVDDRAFVPLSVAYQRLFGGRSPGGASYQISALSLAVDDPAALPLVQARVAALLRERHGLPADGSADDFRFASQADLLETLDSVTSVLTVFLAVVAGISLVVGGIGVMNIMLVSVSERTREIGLRKAVGARSGDILRQFLLEALALSLLGGLGGVLIALAIAAVVTLSGIFAAPVSPVAVLVALGFSFAVGLFFGIYPARRAARLSPIDALQSE
ncbi:MAG: ABC transporter permease [Chloroflexi bacterium OHK40]